MPTFLISANLIASIKRISTTMIDCFKNYDDDLNKTITTTNCHKEKKI